MEVGRREAPNVLYCEEFVQISEGYFTAVHQYTINEGIMIKKNKRDRGSHLTTYAIYEG